MIESGPSSPVPPSEASYPTKTQVYKDISELLDRTTVLKAKRLLQPGQAEKLMEQVDRRKDEEDIYSHVLTRIGSEVPGILEDFRELAIDDQVLNGEVAESMHGVKVNWGQRVNMKKCAGGYYYPHDRKIDIAYMQPQRTQTLASLGVDGVLSYPLVVLAHEMTHHYQWYQPNTDGKLNPAPLPMDRELKEGQAFLVSHPDAGYRQIKEVVLKTEDEAGNLLYPGMNEAKLQNAIRSFQLLNHMGFTQPQIAELVRNPGVWNDAQETYSVIDPLVKKSAKAAHLEADDLDYQHYVVRDYERTKARTIVAETMEDVFGAREVIRARAFTRSRHNL